MIRSPESCDCCPEDKASRHEAARKQADFTSEQLRALSGKRSSYPAQAHRQQASRRGQDCL